MKPKSFITIALVAAATAGLWLCFHHQQPQVGKSISELVQSDITSLPRPVPANASKMTTVISATVVVQSPPLSPAISSDWSAIQTIVNTNAGYEERLEAIASLSGHLTDSDWQALKPFLLTPDPMDNGQLGQVIKNELLDRLCTLNPPPDGLGDVLTRIYRHYEQNKVIRDYAVQHMAAYYEQMTGQRNNDEALESIQKVLWQAVNEQVGSVSGTALLALNRLSQEYTNFNRGEIASTALAMANNAGSDELTRITAYQVCAQLNVKDALPSVLEAAQNGESISVKMSAIGALGLLGSSEQIPFLNSMLAGDEERLKPAAQHALEQIASRQNQLASQK